VSLTLYLFYMVLFVGLGAWVLFLALMRERDEPGEDSSEDDPRREK